MNPSPTSSLTPGKQQAAKARAIGHPEVAQEYYAGSAEILRGTRGDDVPDSTGGVAASSVDQRCGLRHQTRALASAAIVVGLGGTDGMRKQGKSLAAADGFSNHQQPEQPIATLLVAWQTTGARPALEQLLAATRPRLERRITGVLRHHGVHDPNAVEDAMSLVLDHVRRLPGPAAGDRPVVPFEPARAGRGNHEQQDAGLGYLLRLAGSRALDLARTRRTKDGIVFSDLPPALPVSVPSRTSRPHPMDRILAAAAELEPRQRAVIELLLDGQSQAMIAAALELSEGTVSRLRARAVARLRERLAPIR